MVRVFGRKAQRLSAVNDILSESESNVGNPVLRPFVANGIEIQRTSNPRERWIEIRQSIPVSIHRVIPRANNLLQNDGHLFLVNQVLGRRQIGLAVAIEHRSVNSFDGRTEQPQHHTLRNHVGLIHASERLIVGILQQTRRAHRQRSFNNFKQRQQVIKQTCRQRCVFKRIKDFSIGDVT